MWGTGSSERARETTARVHRHLARLWAESLVLPPVVVSELVEVLKLLVLCVDDDVERLVLVEVV